MSDGCRYKEGIYLVDIIDTEPVTCLWSGFAYRARVNRPYYTEKPVSAWERG